MSDDPHAIPDHAEFRRLLHAGHGRVILFLGEHPSEPYHDSILDACLYHTAYDRQSEGTRGPYMLDLMHASGHFQVYRQYVLDALRTSISNYEIGARWKLTKITSVLLHAGSPEGDKEAEDILYEFVTEVLEQGGELAADGIVSLHGIS